MLGSERPSAAESPTGTDIPSGSKPLVGITAIEIGNSIAAPYAGLILSDLGAEVIKVENPKAGDAARGWGPPFWDGDATAFHALNRGKKSITVDLTDPDQAARFRRLVLDHADVVLQNMRAGTIDRYGFGAESLRAEKPELIYCDLSAFGDVGPLKDRPGYDPLMQAFAGIMSFMGEGGGRPPVRIGVSTIDMGAGMWSVIGILASLLERARTKQGASIKTSLYETALGWMSVPMAGYEATGELRQPFGSGVAEIVPYQCFLTAGGWLMIAAGSDGLYRKLCSMLGHPEWSTDPRFVKNADRVRNREILVPMVQEAIRDLPIDEMMRRLDEAGVPNAPLQSMAQVSAHPQTAALDIVRTGPEGSLPLTCLPLRFDNERPAPKWPTPKLGEHDSTLLEQAAKPHA